MFKSIVKSIYRRLVPRASRESLARQRQRIAARYDPTAAAERRERAEFLRRAMHLLGFNGISGDYLEFGCFSGTTFSIAYYEARKSPVPRRGWAFDSFQGLPAPAGELDHHPYWKEGVLSMSAAEFVRELKQRSVPDSWYHVVSGFYANTLAPDKWPGLPRDVALAYVDCDMYSSTRVVLTFLTSRLKHGMIIAFDDYFCYSDKALAGDRRAMLEMLNQSTRWAFVPYLGIGWHGMSFIVEDKALHPAR